MAITTDELKLRVTHKHDTEENWLKATNFTPKQAEIIVYDIDANYNYERFKIGDGTSNVNDLPFAGATNASKEFYGPAPVLPLPPSWFEEEYRIPIKIRIQDNEINGEGTGNIPYYRYVDRELVFEAWSDPTSFVYTETFTIYDYPGGMEQTLDYSITISYSWDGWVITNDTDGVITFLIEGDITLAGSGKVLTETSKNFSIVNDWSTNNVPAIKIGNTLLTETKLSQLSSEKVVLYSEQSLTAEQKAQARANIGAAEDSILEMVDSIEDCIDTSKRYVLPDGYVYAWTYGEHIVESKNHILSSINSDGAPYNGGKGYKEGYRLNSGGVETSSSTDIIVSGFIPYNGEDIELRIPNTDTQNNNNYFHIYNSDFSIIKATSDGTSIDGSYRLLHYWVSDYGATATVEDATGTIKYIIPKELIYKDAAYIRVSSWAATTVNSNTFDLALNEGLDDSEVIIDYSWQNTGLYYGSPDTGNRLDELETAVNNHEERLTTLESGSASDNDISTDVPEYWKEHLSEKADAIQTAMEKAGRNKSAFLWYTDAHWVNGNSKVSPKLLNYLYMNTPMNKVNFGGDIIGDTLLATREEMKYLYEWRKAIKDLPNHHSVFGNHDMLNLDTVDYEDDNYRYAFLLAPEESSDMVMGDGNYYYIDNPCEKTRYLYIAHMTTNLEAMMVQGQFICDAMKAVPKGWHIVAIAHRWWQYSKLSTPTTGAISAYEAEMLSVFDAYNARETRSGSNYFYSQDFTQAKGKVEFCIGGHIHVDYDIESEGGIPIIITTSDTNQNRVPDSTVDSGTVGTITESAVFGIIADYNDPNNTKITVVGVGRGTSRVVQNSSVKPTSISNIAYNGSTTIGATIDKSKFSFTVDYSNGTTDAVNGATSVSPATIGVVGDNTVTITYTEGTTTLNGTATIVGTPVPVVNLFSLDRTYVTGAVGDYVHEHFDESKAFTNVVQATNAFVQNVCTVSNVTENGVTVKESGLGGTSVVYPVYMPDIGTKAHTLSFDYTGDGSSRVWYKYITAAGVIDQNVNVVNKAGSGHIDHTIPANPGFAGLMIFIGANTGKTTTISNVSLTKVE